MDGSFNLDMNYRIYKFKWNMLSSSFPQIYALNKVMTELENENFRKFMEEHSADTLPVWW